MVTGIATKSASHCGWLSAPLQLFDLPFLADRLTMHCVLKPFNHRLEVLEASLDCFETPRFSQSVPSPETPPEKSCA